MSRIGIQTWGSEGDVRPFLALGETLAAAGHDVRIAVTDMAGRRYSAPSGVTLEHVGTGAALPPERVDDVTESIMRTASSPKQVRIVLEHLFTPVVRPMLEAARELCRDSDLVIRHHFLHVTQSAAHHARIPEVPVHLAPNMIASADVPPPGFPAFGSGLLRLGWALVHRAGNRLFRSQVNAVRSELGLPRLHDVLQDAWMSPDATLVAVAPALWERPRDWPVSVHLTGFLRPPATEIPTIDPALAAFLEEGDRPVYVTFGSLFPATDPARRELVEVLAAAAREASCRMVIQTGDSTVDCGSHVHLVERSPHAAVFRRCAAVVHHGGAGTTQTALEAGVPSVVVPHITDQFFWADRLHQLGVAPAPLPRKKLAAARLAARLRTARHNSEMRARATQLSASVSGHDGLSTAAGIIDGVLRDRGR